MRTRTFGYVAGIDQSAPISSIHRSSNIGQMIWRAPEVIAELLTLQPGDLLFTGTPDGVGLLQPGDGLRAASMAPMKFRWNWAESLFGD